jgi:hypothetical protein
VMSRERSLGGHLEELSNERIGRIVAGWPGETIGRIARDSKRVSDKDAVLLVITTRRKPSHVEETRKREPVQLTQEEQCIVHISDTSTTIPTLVQTHRIAPFSFPQPTTSPPTQNGFKALGKSNPSILFSSPSLNCTPFSRIATSNRGMAAAVPFRVCANGSGASDSTIGRYRI